ncbi:minor capsid protein [uncultured Treponema sp.]|jgi:SPP1 gp7 family putative phage head morphogenesis protein|uniref:minor capsid protein n=2 Tax=uncultured Treponema sp. TaxID=162155 RepID=UPI00205B47A3|nr:minor capsid protein [uncultured Treponema sp.]DAL19674.1 MAG TPA_asm: putative head morphogenesis protein [Caudoviricetes sp.]
MANSVYPLKINGYIYSPKTRQGFLRMRRMGIPRPLFSIENELAKTLASRYKKLAAQLLKDLKDKIKRNGLTIDRALVADGKEEENLERLMKVFDEMGEKMRKEQEETANRANMGSVANSLEHEWFEENQEEQAQHDEQFYSDVERIFKKQQKKYLERLLDDADGKTKRILQSFTIDKKKFFDDNMDEVRRLYVQNSLERIDWEQEDIKRAILKRITDYAMNRTDELKLDDLTKDAFNRGEHLARLFARDQMARFNKACTLATFRSAGVTKVQWLTANDGRVRETHRMLNKKIFDVDNLPKEINDYNCRCGLVPVEWADD